MYKDTKKKKNTTSTDVFSILAELIFMYHVVFFCGIFVL
jgi:hypothetical protein